MNLITLILTLILGGEPLLVVFALSYRGISSQRLSRWVLGSMRPVKLLLTSLFLGLAVLTALT